MLLFASACWGNCSCQLPSASSYRHKAGRPARLLQPGQAQGCDVPGARTEPARGAQCPTATGRAGEGLHGLLSPQSGRSARHGAVMWPHTSVSPRGRAPLDARGPKAKSLPIHFGSIPIWMRTGQPERGHHQPPLVSHSGLGSAAHPYMSRQILAPTAAPHERGHAQHPLHALSRALTP